MDDIGTAAERGRDRGETSNLPHKAWGITSMVFVLRIGLVIILPLQLPKNLIPPYL